MIHEDIPFEERAAVSQAMESRCVAELLGMARLLDFGGEVTEAQRDFLRQWLREVPRAIRCWPIPEVGRVFSGPLEDVLPFLRDILRTQAEEDAQRARHLEEAREQDTSPVLSIFTEPVPDIVFKGKRFCFTGNFRALRREVCESAVSHLGGWPGGNGARCNYLVVGGKGSRHWAQKNFGRKVQEAMTFNRTLREERHPWREPVRIVREDDWIAAVEKAAGMPLEAFLDALLGYRPSAVPVTVDWEHHGLRVLREMFETVPDTVDWTQSKTRFVIYHPCRKPRLTLLKMRYGKYGISRVDNAEGDPLYSTESGWHAGKRTQGRLRAQLWGEE